MDYIYKKIKDYGKVRGNESLSKHITVNTGGPVDYFIFLNKQEDVVGFLKEVENSDLNFFIMGQGGNVLIADSGFTGVVGKIEASDKKIKGDKLIVEAGADITKTAQYTMMKGYSGLEWGVGAAGSIGGNIYNKEQVLGKGFKDCLDKIKVYNSGKVYEYSFDELKSFDNLEPNCVILEVVFELQPVDQNDPQKAMEYMNYKKEKLAAHSASLGPIFKPVYNQKVPKLDVRTNENYIHPHILIKNVVQDKNMELEYLYENNFNLLINTSSATSLELLNVIEKIEHKVYDKHKVELQRKVKTIGF